MAQKLTEVAGCHTGSQDVPEEQNQDVCTPQVGQHHSGGIHQQPGRDSLQGIGKLGKEPVDVVLRTKHPHHCPTPARHSEQDSRCRVTDNEGLVRLATESSPVQQDCLPVWSHRSGHVCLTPDHSVPSLFQLAARSLYSGYRCLSAGLVSDQGVCQTPFEPDWSSSVQGVDRSDLHCTSGTSLEDTAMVPTTSANCDAMSYNPQPGNDKQRSGGSNPSTSHVAYLRERYREQELSEEASSLMLKSWRTKTNKFYNSLFGKWHSWRRARGSDPFSGPIKEVVNFMAALHKEGYQY